MVVITSSDAIQYAFEGETVNGNVTSSAFTSVFVEGLRSGRADLNGDGKVGLTELFQYITETMRAKRSVQTPEINNFRLQGEIFIAVSRNQSIEVPLTWEDAQKGGEKSVRIGEREQVIKIPQHVKDGDHSLYEGLGLPNPDGGAAGNLTVTFRVGPPPASVIQAQRKRNTQLIFVAATAVLTISLSLVGFSHGILRGAQKESQATGLKVSRARLHTNRLLTERRSLAVFLGYTLCTALERKRRFDLEDD